MNWFDIIKGKYISSKIMKRIRQNQVIKIHGLN